MTHRDRCLGEMLEPADLPCGFCGVVTLSGRLRYHLQDPKSGKRSSGMVLMPAPHRAPCGRQCANSSPVEDWTEDQGVCSGRKCPRCEKARGGPTP